MVAYNFKKRFAEAIAMGWKRQTIRGPRKRHARPGEEMQLYTGMRTRHCRLIRRTTCLSVQHVEITLRWLKTPMLADIPLIMIDSAPVTDCDAFARADGFRDIHEMAEFWWTENLLDEERARLRADQDLSCTWENGALIKW